MQNLSQILKKQKNLSPLWRRVNASLIVEEANKILAGLLGAETLKHANAVYFKNNALTFTCLSSTFAQEIRLNQNKIITALNNKFGSNTITNIKYLA